MKITTIATMFLLGGAGVATAAHSAPDTAGGPASFDWSGAYVGLNLGYGWGESDFADSQYNGAPPAYPTVKWNTHSDGWLAGISTGYNWRHGRVVYGVEGELGHLNLSGRRMQPGVDPNGFPYDASGRVKKGWYGGLSARLGYAPDRTLFYAKAGVVYSAARLGFADTCTVAPCGDSMANASRRVGWGYQFGAGVEHAVSDHWTLEVEYAYLDFGKTTIRGTAVGGSFHGAPYQVKSDLTMHTVKLGVNYKF